MSSILLNTERDGNFTSSKISKLLTNGKQTNGLGEPATTYIKERNIERRMGRSLETDTYSKDMMWGSFLEQRVELMLEFGFTLVSNETKVHDEIPYWCGSTDFRMDGVKIAELKCYQPKKFCMYTDAILTQNIEVIKKDFAEEYWQVVSNAIINKVPNAELITYMPYQSELTEIREMADNYDGPEELWKVRFIVESPDSGLAYLPDGGYYKNFNRFEFKIPQEDIELLTERVKMCGKMLTDFNPLLEINNAESID